MSVLPWPFAMPAAEQFPVTKECLTGASFQDQCSRVKIGLKDSHNEPPWFSGSAKVTVTDAYLLRNQAVSGKVFTPLESARELGVAVMCSASILQGKLAHSVPFHIRAALGNPLTDALAAIQFVRATPDVTTALVGMSSAAHVEENMNLRKAPSVSKEEFEGLFQTP